MKRREAPMARTFSRLGYAAILATGLAACGPAAAETNATRAAAGNLLINGGFEAPGDPLKGWISDFAWADNKWYRDNASHVSVVASGAAGGGHALRLSATRQILWGDGQGVKVDSHPVPFETGVVYRLTVKARSVARTSNPGPNSRIYIEGYAWKPGVKPHDNPHLSDLRKVYKQGSGNILYFGATKSGPFSNPSAEWSTGMCQFPGKDLSEQAQRQLRQIRFICVHIVAIDGWDGDLLVDDVVLEKAGP
jgi:hypothetical protein